MRIRLQRASTTPFESEIFALPSLLSSLNIEPFSTKNITWIQLPLPVTVWCCFYFYENGMNVSTKYKCTKKASKTQGNKHKICVQIFVKSRVRFFSKFSMCFRCWTDGIHLIWNMTKACFKVCVCTRFVWCVFRVLLLECNLIGFDNLVGRVALC